ncbi:MAG: CHAT domain-containing protein [bacterium]
MATMKYLDFDLLLEHSEGAYLVRVLRSPGGEAKERFALPFSDQELGAFFLTLERLRRKIQRLDLPELEEIKAFGGRLFEAAFQKKVRACLQSSLAHAEAHNTGLRIRLRLNAPELADLPWEYLYNVEQNRFLALCVETPLVRYLEISQTIQPLEVKPPLKILVMISNSNDYPMLEVAQEWEKLHEALAPLEQRQLVTLERLEAATLEALQRRLRQGPCHIFHFIGHGKFDERTQNGMLLLEDEFKQGHRVSGRYLGTILHNHQPLRLAVLNACEGARTSRLNPFAGAAQDLVHQGIPAIVAMQSEITDTAAITFSNTFYAAMADNYPVDAALVEARTAIYSQGNEVEWGTPVLYMRAPDGRIFDVEKTLKRPVDPPTATPSVQEQSTRPSSVHAGQRHRLEQKVEALRQEWNLLSEKIKRLRAALAVETDVAVKFKLEQQFQGEEGQLAQLEVKPGFDSHRLKNNRQTPIY